MSTESELRRIAREIAEQAQARVAGLEREIFDLETRIAEKKAERDAAGLAPKRLLDYAIRLGADYQCPRCWIEHERRAALRSIPSNAGDIDLFRCGACGETIEIRFR